MGDGVALVISSGGPNTFVTRLVNSTIPQSNPVRLDSIRLVFFGARDQLFQVLLLLFAKVLKFGNLFSR